MKLVRQTKLSFKQGTSDKVYEVDLCEVGDQFLVNFRYGKRGGPLKEGTKTKQPVDRANADKIYDKLVLSKTKKGYTEVAAAAPKKERAQLPPDEGNQQRSIHILKHLVDAAGNQYNKNWKLSRIIWRAGEIRIKDAAPHIMTLARSGDEMQTYCALWALGRCGDPQALPLLQEFVKDKVSKLRRIAKEAILSLLDEAGRDAFIVELLKDIHDELRQNVLGGTHESMVSLLNDHALTRKAKEYNFLETLYIASLEYPHVRSALVETLPKIPLKAGHFRNIRHLFKMAEYRQDGQVFGLLAYRFERTRAGFKKPNWGDEVYLERNWVKISKEIVKPNSRLAFSEATKEYLKRRTWKTMKRTAELGDLSYIKLAMGTLLAYSDDKDKDRAWYNTTWHYDRTTRRHSRQQHHYDEYAKFLNFYRILYGNSSRYELKNGANAFSCKNGYEPGKAQTTRPREEAYPKLWDKMPAAYLHLLAESRVERIDDFAISGINRHPELLDRVDTAFIIRLISKSFERTVAFGVEIAKKQYDPKNPDGELVLALVNSPVKVARDLALGWIKNDRAAFFKDTNFVCGLITSPMADVRQWTKEQVTAVVFTEKQTDVIIMRVFVELISLAAGEDRAKDIGEIMVLAFGTKMQQVSIKVIRDLLAHKLTEVKIFGGKLLLKHNTRPKDLADDLFTILLNADSRAIREIGVELFGQLPDNVLLEKKMVLVGFCLSKKEDIRRAVRPIIARLAAKNAEFGKELTEAFIPKLWKKEKYDGLHQELLLLLSIDLDAFLTEIDQDISLRLLNAKYTAAHELGVILLKKNIDAKNLTMRQIIRIANHEILEARQIAWNMYDSNVDRVKYDREEALRILDSAWDDARAFAFDYFRKNFEEKDWTPTLLVGICDSVRGDVQAYGRELITKFFKEENGVEYLMKLSQHPKAELQLFATNYLARFAAGKVENIHKLEPYFVTVLSLVNKARVAKDRVLQFLHDEAMKDAEVAKLMTKILTRISATSAIEDKATCMEILLKIKDKYPYIQTPLERRAIPVR